MSQKKKKKGGEDSGKGGEKLAKCCRQLKGVNGRLFYEKLPKREWHPEFFLGRGITQRHQSAQDQQSPSVLLYIFYISLCFSGVFSSFSCRRT